MPTITVDGRERSYLLDVPAKLKPRAGLVLVCHGFGDSPESLRGYAGFTKIMEAHNFVFAYPEGTRDKEGKRNFQVEYAFQDPTINDVKFAHELVKKLVNDWHLDPKRVFSTGMSNGADFSYYLARQKRPLVRAIAPIAGCMMDCWDKTLPMKNRMAIMEVHGTKDDVTHWEGDMKNRDGWGAYFGTEAVVEHWVKSLGLTEREIEVKGKLTKSRWWTKRDDSEFILYTIEGGGHSWPERIGNPDKTLAEEILQFFEQHSR